MISQMNAVWISADELKTDEMRAKSKQWFYNYDLGMPYQDVKLQVTGKDVYDNATRENPAYDREDYRWISVGIDWGHKHSVIIGGMRNDGQIEIIRMFQIKEVEATDARNIGADLQALQVALVKYDPDIIVADIGDSGDRVARLINIYSDKQIYGCQYKSDPTSGLAKSSNQIIPTWNDNQHTVTVDKLMQNKRFIGLMKEHDIGFYHKKDEELQKYVSHWMNVVIRDDEQNNGEMRQVITRKGPDHFAQASILCLLGFDKIRADYYQAGSYGFDFTSVNPEPTDIVQQINSGDLFKGNKIDTDNLFGKPMPRG